jgi:ribosomal protein S27E
VQNFSKVFQINDSGFGCLLTFFIVAVLLGSFGLSWIVNSVLILVVLLLLLPVVGWIGLNWWLKRSQVTEKCPVCNYEFTAFEKIECACPSCGETLQVAGGKFTRITPPGTIDVEAIEVSTQEVDE